MLISMTGFGRAEQELDGNKFSVEIKSVNNKYKELNLKIPKFMNEYEKNIRDTLSKYIYRGKVDVYVKYESFNESDYTIVPNHALISEYIKALEEIKSTYKINSDITINNITSIDNVFLLDDTVTEKEKNTRYEMFENVLGAAVENFVYMRSQEGIEIQKNIELKLCEIERLVNFIEKNYETIVQKYKNKLLEKITGILENKNLDEARILTEVALLAEKSCVDEEVVRLLSHIKQFREFMQLDIAVGRKLDFVTQEMNREVNTIGSKANDIETTKIVIELKSLLEQIREQVQNIQ